MSLYLPSRGDVVTPWSGRCGESLPFWLFNWSECPFWARYFWFRGVVTARTKLRLRLCSYPFSSCKTVCRWWRWWVRTTSRYRFVISRSRRLINFTKYPSCGFIWRYNSIRPRWRSFCSVITPRPRDYYLNHSRLWFFDCPSRTFWFLLSMNVISRSWRKCTIRPKFTRRSIELRSITNIGKLFLRVMTRSGWLLKLFGRCTFWKGPTWSWFFCRVIKSNGCHLLKY